MWVRAAILFLFLCLIPCACGDGETKSRDAAEREFTASDGFLRYLPENPRMVARLPSPQRIAEAPEAVAQLLRCLGRGAPDAAQLLYRAEKLAGIDTQRAAGVVTLHGGGWIHYLPAADKGQLNQALSSLVTKFALQE